MMSFVKTVGRHGIEELIDKGYSNVEVANIYEVSMGTLRHAYRQLYGADWKKILKNRKAA